MFDRLLNTLVMSTPQRKYNTKFSKGGPERCKKNNNKTKQKYKINEFNEINTRIQVRILSYTYIPDKEQKQDTGVFH